MYQDEVVTKCPTNHDKTNSKTVALSSASTVPIKYTLRFAIPFMLSFSTDVDTVWKWLMSSFVLIKYRKKNNLPYLKIGISNYNNPFIKTTYPITIIKNVKPDRIIQKIIKYINKDYCILLRLDRYWLPGYSNYLENHFTHTECIFGYSLSDNSFQLVGYNGNRITYTTQSFHAIVEAVQSASASPIVYYMIAQKRKNYHGEFDVKKAFLGIRCYYQSNYTLSYWVKTQFKKIISEWDLPFFEVYGIAVTDLLIELIDKKIHYGENHISFLLQWITAMSENKLLMRYRIRYLYKEGYFEPYTTVFGETELENALVRLQSIGSKMRKLILYAYEYKDEANESTLILISDILKSISIAEKEAMGIIVKIIDYCE